MCSSRMIKIRAAQGKEWTFLGNPKSHCQLIQNSNLTVFDFWG